MKKFEHLSPSEKRVAIAKDTLKWLKKGKIKPRRGRVMGGFGLIFGEPLREQLISATRKCEVCQRGGLLYSYVMRVNNFNVPWDTSLGGSYACHTVDGNSKLQEVFSRKQLMLIEDAFEGTEMNVDHLPFGEGDKAKRFYKRYSRQEDRFLAILNNIIKNKGEFIP